MDKSDKILAAIEHLAKNLTGQIAAVDAKLTGQIAAVAADVARVDAKLTGQIAAVAADVARVDAKVDAVAADVAALQIDVAVLKVGQAQILDHLDVAELKGRVEEQSRTIASLIPTRVAAIPGR